MIRPVLAALAVLSSALVAAPALAAESPRRGAFEFRMNRYRPNIDSEFGGAAAPYTDTYGSGDGWMFRAEVSRSVLKTLGTLDVGIGAGYFAESGRALLPDGTASADRTTFRIVPVSLSLTYRLDVLRSGYVLPVMPYGRVAFERFNWRTTGGSGDTSEVDGRKGRGATHGFSFTGGVALLLDIIDRRLAREMDADTGINHTYLFFDVTKSYIDDFGSSSSIDLSNDDVVYGAGLMFIY